MVEAARVATVLEASAGPECLLIFEEHVSSVIAGEGMLTLVLRSGHRIERSMSMVRHGNDARLLTGEPDQEQSSPTPQLVKLMRDARRAREFALKRPTVPLDRLAAEFGRSAERFKRLVRLSYLSPAIVEQILSGDQPPELTSVRLQNLDGLPRCWVKQHEMLLG
jgi:hypothetical protein